MTNFLLYISNLGRCTVPGSNPLLSNNQSNISTLFGVQGGFRSSGTSNFRILRQALPPNLFDIARVYCTFLSCRLDYLASFTSFLLLITLVLVIIFHLFMHFYFYLHQYLMYSKPSLYRTDWGEGPVDISENSINPMVGTPPYTPNKVDISD